MSAYQPLLVAPRGGLPADAFARSRAALLQAWGSLALSDEAGFRLQTPWVSHQLAGTPGRKRATVFLAEPGSLGVVVEVSYLVQGMLGDFAWTSVRGDPELERLLAEVLQKALE